MIKICSVCGEPYIIRTGTEDKGICKKHVKCDRCGKIEDKDSAHMMSRYCGECRKIIKSENAKKQHEFIRTGPKKKIRGCDKPEFTIDDLCKIRNALDLPNHMEIIQREIKRRGVKIVRGKVIETWKPEQQERK